MADRPWLYSEEETFGRFVIGDMSPGVDTFKDGVCGVTTAATGADIETPVPEEARNGSLEG